jgi:acyl-coenzyme A synthetase/AMP-(fatty) acid ligase
MRPPPTTLETIEAIALRDPRPLALREDDLDVSYGELYAMAFQCSRELHRLGVRRGHRVAVSGPGFALQLVVLLAAEALGACTASFQAEGDSDAPFLFTLVDWVCSARPQQVPEGVGFVLLDADFGRVLRQPLGPGPRPWSALALHEPQRIARTSGSTGRSKFMLVPRQAQEYWIRSTLDVAGYTSDSRLLVLGPLVINAAFTRSSRCLRGGGAVMAGHGSRVAHFAPTDVWGLPMQLERFLDEVPDGYRVDAPVSVATVGGTVTPALRERTHRVFANGPILNRYGSNEVGPICDDLDATGTGLLSPGVDVRILGPQGEELPLGQAGTIAVRTPAMAEGYLALPAETAAAFRDGWFISADVGTLVAPRMLRLAGRQDDLINVAGIKVPASDVEARLRAQPAIADCAVLAANLEGGTVTLGVAMVLAPGAKQQDAVAQLQAALRLGPGMTARMLFLSELPRLHTGKLDRMALQQLFQRAGTAGSGAGAAAGDA